MVIDESPRVRTAAAEQRIDVRRLVAVLVGNGLLRVANSGAGALVGFYMAYLAAHGRGVDAALVGLLGVVFSGAELVGALPFGVLADRFSPRVMMVFGALLGGAATQLFGISGLIAIFYLSRALEGLASAASGPALLGHLTDVTQAHPSGRGRIMGFYELSFLAGLALGSLVGGTLWDRVGTLAFSLLAVVYLAVAALFFWGTGHPRSAPRRSLHPLAGLRRALADRLLLRLAPAWLAVNAIVGMWLNQIGFQLTRPGVAGQYLVGRFSASQVGLVLLGFALIFAIGVTLWGFALAYIPRLRALRIALGATFIVCFCLYMLNLSADWSAAERWAVVVVAALAVAVQSGFTPAALAYLADLAEGEGRGTTMGIYTLLLGLGHMLGAGLGGTLARGLAFNGLIVGTLGLGVVALVALSLLPASSN